MLLFPVNLSASPDGLDPMGHGGLQELHEFPDADGRLVGSRRCELDLGEGDAGAEEADGGPLALVPGMEVAPVGVEPYLLLQFGGGLVELRQARQRPRDPVAPEADCLEDVVDSLQLPLEQPALGGRIFGEDEALDEGAGVAALEHVTLELGEREAGGLALEARVLVEHHAVLGRLCVDEVGVAGEPADLQATVRGGSEVKEIAQHEDGAVRVAYHGERALLALGHDLGQLRRAESRFKRQALDSFARDLLNAGPAACAVDNYGGLALDAGLDLVESPRLDGNCPLFVLRGSRVSRGVLRRGQRRSPFSGSAGTYFAAPRAPGSAHDGLDALVPEQALREEFEHVTHMVEHAGNPGRVHLQRSERVVVLGRGIADLPERLQGAGIAEEFFDGGVAGTRQRCTLQNQTSLLVSTHLGISRYSVLIAPPSNDRSTHTTLASGKWSRRFPTAAMPAGPPPMTMASACFGAAPDSGEAWVDKAAGGEDDALWLRRVSQSGRKARELFCAGERTPCRAMLPRLPAGTRRPRPRRPQHFCANGCIMHSGFESSRVLPWTLAMEASNCAEEKFETRVTAAQAQDPLPLLPLEKPDKLA